MSYTSNAAGSLARYVVPEAKWSQDLTGVVVEVSQKTAGNQGPPRLVNVEYVSFNGDETTEQVRAMLKTAVAESDSRFFRSITATYLNPDFDSNGRLVAGSGTKVSGRYVFSPDPKVKSQKHAMQAYARVTTEILDDMVLTLGSRKQVVNFVTISRLAQFKGMQSDAVENRVSFRWSPFESATSESEAQDIEGL